jgi:segregation and condensation protein A
MTLPFQPALDFEAAEQAAHGGAALVLALDGYEGPLHLLLALARNQKVDLRQISVARLAEQYLAFVESQTAQFGLAAEYLVMAAWLAYLKSRLLLPKPAAGADEPPAEELAEALAFRLAKLDAMRKAAEALKARPQLGRDVFARGDPEAVTVRASQRVEGSLYELMEAYANARARPAARRYTPAARVDAYPLEAARERLKDLLPRLREWTTLDRVAPEAQAEGPGRRSCVASTFSAGLEMTRDGALELKQAESFAALYLRARAAGQP